MIEDIRPEGTVEAGGIKKRGGGPGRSASSCPLSGKSGQPDGGRLAGRVLACLYNPGRRKKVPEKMQKSDKIFEADRRSAEMRKTCGLPTRVSPNHVTEKSYCGRKAQGRRPELQETAFNLCHAHPT